MYITRAEFDAIGSLGELRDVCQGIVPYDGRASRLVDEDEMDREMDTRISDFLVNEYWYRLASELEGIERGYDWYVDDGMFDYHPVTDEEEFLREEKELLFEFICENGGFDDEELETETVVSYGYGNGVTVSYHGGEPEEEILDGSYVADMLLSACS